MRATNWPRGLVSWWTRRQRRHVGPGQDGGDTGAILILALAYILVIGLTVAAVSTWATNDLNNSTHFSDASALRYAATSATDAAIQSIRYDPIPTTTPAQGVATLVNYCWSPNDTLPSGAEVSDLTVDGYTVAVWCSTIEELSSSDTRDVIIYACQTSTAETGTACAAAPLLSAEVAIDDYPAGGGPTFTQQCNILGDSCGAGTTLENWDWGGTGGTFATQKSQTIAFYTSSYTTPITSDTTTFGSGTYQLYAQGSGGGAVTYGSLTQGVCTVSALGAVTLVTSGTCTLTADAAAATGYTDSGVDTFLLTIGQAATSVAVSSSVNPVVVNQSVTYSAIVTVNSSGTGTPTGSVEFFDGGTLIGLCAAQSLSTTSPLTATCTISYSTSGPHLITAEYLGDSNFAASSVSPSTAETVNSLSYGGGSGTQNLPSSPGDYYIINQNQPGTPSASGLVDEYSPGSATTLTGLTVTLTGSTTYSSQTVTVYLIDSGTSNPTGLTCTIGSHATTCSITTSVSVPAGDSINVLGVGSGKTSVSWAVTYTQP